MTDANGFSALLEFCEQTNEIEQIWLGATPPQDFSQQSYPLLWIKPTKWEQTEDTDPAEPLRTVHFELRICARGQGGIETFERLDGIAETLLLLVEHQSLGGSIPALTVFTRGRNESQHQVEQLVIEGSFAYLRDQPE